MNYTTPLVIDMNDAFMLELLIHVKLSVLYFVSNKFEIILLQVKTYLIKMIPSFLFLKSSTDLLKLVCT